MKFQEGDKLLKYQSLLADGVPMWDYSLGKHEEVRAFVQAWELGRDRKEVTVKCDNCEKYSIDSQDGFMGTLPIPVCHEYSDYALIRENGRVGIKQVLFPFEKNKDSRCPDYKRKWWKFWVKEQ